VDLSKFREMCYEEFKRDYYMDESTYHAKALCYCRHKMMNQSYDEVMKSDMVILGLLVDRGIGSVMRNSFKVYSKKVGKYTVKGTPDYFEDGNLVEYKFTMYTPKSPRPHDIMQVKMYMWLVGVDSAKIWYFSSKGIAEFDVEGAYNDDDVLRIIENPRNPMWNWECRYCSLYPCKYKTNREINDVEL